VDELVDELVDGVVAAGAEDDGLAETEA